MGRARFQLVSEFRPTGDQPEAIQALVRGVDSGMRFQTLEGVTGSGKTFTISNMIARSGRPTLVISHNKTLAAQLYAEFRHFFPHSAVHYFVSYYDYYQPEAYIPQTDTYIEKDASINEEIERLRLAATDALLNRDDVIIVASVSCIYGLGSPEDYRGMLVNITRGQECPRDEVLRRLVEVQYSRNDAADVPGTFGVHGDTLDIRPGYQKEIVRVEFWGDAVERIAEIDPVTRKTLREMNAVRISPAKHFVLPREKIDRAIEAILEELEERVAWFEERGKLLEAQRLRMRTEYDVEMLREMGYCAGIENYSRHLSGRAPGERPATLLDFFPEGFLTIIDESHVTLPQLRGMYNADQSRKRILVEHGFRLPSALDNRPMNFEEFLDAVGQVVFTSATPGTFEREVSGQVVEQVIRPTGIVDPSVEVRPLGNQIDDLIREIRLRARRGERVLVTTLTKRTAEDLSEYLQEAGLRVKYLHSEIDAIERVEIIRGLRRADFDCLVGINLLREGLDIPEVSLVAILDADKEGFLRSETSLIQTAGRAARHVNGKVILYADDITDSMRALLAVTQRRRRKQLEYNRRHGITPRSIRKALRESLAFEKEAREAEIKVVREGGVNYGVYVTVEELEKEMIEAAQALEFERAALLRDIIRQLKGKPARPRAAEDSARPASRRRRRPAPRGGRTATRR